MIVDAKIHFDIPHVTKKHVAQSTWKTTAVAQIEGDLAGYYAWFIYKRFGLKLIKPLRKSHVTFVNDSSTEIINLDAVKELWDTQPVEIVLDRLIRTNGKHWWLKAFCDKFDIIRASLGLGKPWFSYHLTLGKIKDEDLRASEYFHDVLLNECKYGKSS